jgi:N-acetylneuraminic acid mutarotase
MTDFYYDLKFNIDQTLYPGNVAFNVDVYYFQNMGGTETLIDQKGLTYNDASSFGTSVNNWGLTGVLNPLGLAGENQAVPEPTSILLLGSVIFGLAIGLRKKLA